VRISARALLALSVLPVAAAPAAPAGAARSDGTYPFPLPEPPPPGRPSAVALARHRSAGDRRSSLPWWRPGRGRGLRPAVLSAPHHLPHSGAGPGRACVAGLRLARAQGWPASLRLPGLAAPALLTRPLRLGPRRAEPGIHLLRHPGDLQADVALRARRGARPAPHPLERPAHGLRLGLARTCSRSTPGTGKEMCARATFASAAEARHGDR